MQDDISMNVYVPVSFIHADAIQINQLAVITV